jgi:hypothetical protein
MWNVGPPAVVAALTAQFRFDLEWMLLALVLVGLVALGIFVIVRFKRWMAEQQSPTLPTRVEDYRALLEQGLLDPAEFECIRQELENNHPPDAPSRSTTAVPTADPPTAPNPRQNKPQA